jgi:hypothetical protein
MSYEYFDTLLLVRLCMGIWRNIPQTVRKKYTTFSTERIVAIRSVSRISPESYDFADNVNPFSRSPYYHPILRNTCRKQNKIRTLCILSIFMRQRQIHFLIIF